MINFTDLDKKFCVSWHYNGSSSYLFVNGVEIIKFKQKYSEIKAIWLCLGNVSKEFLVDKIKEAGFYGYVYDVSIDYDASITVWIF